MLTCLIALDGDVHARCFEDEREELKRNEDTKARA